MKAYAENRASLSAYDQPTKDGTDATPLLPTCGELTRSPGLATSTCKELGIANMAHSYMHFFLSHRHS